MAPSCVHHCPTSVHLSVSLSVSKNVHKGALYMYMEVLVMDVSGKFTPFVEVFYCSVILPYFRCKGVWLNLMQTFVDTELMRHNETSILLVNDTAI